MKSEAWYPPAIAALDPKQKVDLSPFYAKGHSSIAPAGLDLSLGEGSSDSASLFQL
jgi:hypothetical protein